MPQILQQVSWDIENAQLSKPWFLRSGRGYESAHWGRLCSSGLVAWEGELTTIVSGKALAAGIAPLTLASILPAASALPLTFTIPLVASSATTERAS